MIFLLPEELLLPCRSATAFQYDLDFFGSSKLSIDNILIILNERFHLEEMHRTQNIVVLNLAGVKVDFVKYNYPLISDLRIQEGIRLMSVNDIGTMKLDAIKGRGRKRDFYDLYFLLQEFDLR